MRYRVILKQLVDGDFYARCDAGPRGPVAGRGASPEEALESLRQEIRYHLELCPCSADAGRIVELEVVEPRRPPRRRPTSPTDL